MPALSRPLAAFAALGLAYVVFTQEVAGGALHRADLAVGHAVERLWREPLHPLMQAVAVLGGVEVTALIALALFVYLRRRGFRAESWALLVFPAAIAVELVYKRVLDHPTPPFAHLDGPSLSLLLARQAHLLGNSYPSGHMVRTVIVYGLLGFVVSRLAPPGRVPRLAVVAAAVMIAVMALDRLYLGVHWESDVVGGLLLGGLGLAGAILWLERPQGG